MDVSVIIVNYNTKELIADCIRSIHEKTTEITYEIIVTDNASSDGSQKMIKDTFPDVILIELAENIGFGRANNKAVDLAKGKYLFLLNSDTRLLNNSLLYFFNFMEEKNKRNEIGSIGSLLIDFNHNICHSSGYFPNFYSDIKLVLLSYIKPGIKKKEITTFNLYQDSFDVDYITGADLFIERNIYEKLGGFDPDYFMYYEETDLQFRMNKLNLKRKIIAGPQIIHLEGGSFNSKKKSNHKRIMFDISRFIYFKKNHSIIIYKTYRIIYFCVRAITYLDKSYTKQERIDYIRSLTKKV